MGVLPVDVDLGEEGELGVVGALHVLLDLGLVAWLLAHELVAGEGQHLEAQGVVLVVQGSQLGVLLLGEPSLGGYVDHQQTLALGVVGHLHILLVDVQRLQFEEVVCDWFHQ